MAFDLDADRDRARLGDHRGSGRTRAGGALEPAGRRTTRGSRQGLVAARRQVVGCVQQAEVWSGTGGSDTPTVLPSLVDRFDARGRRCTRRCVRRSRSAPSARPRPTPSFARYLIEEYSPHASERDPVGRGAVRGLGPGVQRHRARPRRDLRLGMGRAAPHRARDGHRRRADPSRRAAGRGHRAARDRSAALDRGRGRRCAPGCRT